MLDVHFQANVLSAGVPAALREGGVKVIVPEAMFAFTPVVLNV
jgi:hypothetical protein